MSVRPLYDNVVVRRLDANATTAGGIVIPDSANEKSNQGEVIAVGPGSLLDNGSLRPLSVKPGDRVLFSSYASNEIKLNGEKVLILKETDILGVIETKARLEKAA